MAIITNISHVHNFLRDDISLEYLYSVCDNNHVNQKRILNLSLGACRKEYIGSELFVLEQSYMTKFRSDCFWESHKRFIDIQLHLDGIEQMEFVDIKRLEILEPYNREKDLVVYRDSFCVNRVVMQKNDVVIFFPEDAHLGMSMYNKSPSHIHKTVIKYPLELWK